VGSLGLRPHFRSFTEAGRDVPSRKFSVIKLEE
jgi:hypothetical protein